MRSESNECGCLCGIMVNVTIWGTLTVAATFLRHRGVPFWIGWPALLAGTVPLWWAYKRRSALATIPGRIMARLRKEQAKRARRRLLRSRLSKTEAQMLLIAGIKSQDCDVVRLCIRDGADVNAADAAGLTPLMIAARGVQERRSWISWEEECFDEHFTPSSPEVLQLLLDAGPTLANLKQSYEEARQGGTNGGGYSFQHVENASALDMLSRQIDRKDEPAAPGQSEPSQIRGI